MKKVLLWATVLLSLAAVTGVPARGENVEPPRISKEDLKAKLGEPGIIVIDVRAGGDFAGDARTIPGAVREDPDNVGAWAARYAKDGTLVLFCA